MTKMKTKIISIAVIALGVIVALAFTITSIIKRENNRKEIEKLKNLQTIEITASTTETTKEETTSIIENAEGSYESPVTSTENTTVPVTTQAKTTTVAATEPPPANCNTSHSWYNAPYECEPSPEGCIATYHCQRDWSHTYTKTISHRWTKKSTNDNGSINYYCTMCGGTYTGPVPETTTSYKGTYLGNFKITGYTDEEGFYYGKTTASGVGCRPGIVAMNRSRMRQLGISYGDKITIKGLGTYTVQDCGCSYNTIDVWVWTNREAYSLTSYRNVYRG